MPYFSRDDIAQVCTPPGRALVGGLRLSGDNAFAILAAVCEGLEEAFAGGPRRGAWDCRLRVRLAVRRRGGEVREAACPARAFLMPAPNSYTREDVAELHLPGSPALLAAGLAALVAAGARPAAPGEFTFRAFRNGRIGLAQAEAVEEAVRSETDAERRAALARLGGRDLSRVAAWRERVLDMAARLEAVLDFSEEELEGDPAADLAGILRDLEREGASAAAGSGAADGGLPEIALVGLANAGKSSLFNALLGGDDAIVSPEPSTTRDSLRREVAWNGARFVISDNPGHHPEGGGSGRDAADRAFARLDAGDAACWVVDASRPLGPREREFAARLPGRVVAVLNKSDLPAAATASAVREVVEASGRTLSAAVAASAVTGDGLDAVRGVLAAGASGASPSGFWNGRERLELASALAGCRGAADELSGPGRLELAAEELRLAAAAFARVLGDGYGETVLTRIFSGFCIGK